MRVLLIVLVTLALGYLAGGVVLKPEPYPYVACTTDVNRDQFFIGNTCDLEEQGVGLFRTQKATYSAPPAPYVHTTSEGDIIEYGSCVEPEPAWLYGKTHGQDAVYLVMVSDTRARFDRYRILGARYVPDTHWISEIRAALSVLLAATAVWLIVQSTCQWRVHQLTRRHNAAVLSHEVSLTAASDTNGTVYRFAVALLLCLWYVWGVLWVSVSQPSVLVSGTLVGLPGAVGVAWVACAWQRLTGRVGAWSAFHLLALFNVWILLFHRHIVLPLAPLWWLCISGALTLVLVVWLDRRIFRAGGRVSDPPCHTGFTRNGEPDGVERDPGANQRA